MRLGAMMVEAPMAALCFMNKRRLIFFGMAYLLLAALLDSFAGLGV
jgi:hypothetical protein